MRAVSEILHYIERIAAANHAEARNVVRRIQQVFPMRRRMHQVVMNLVHSCGVRHVFSSPIKMQRSSACQSLMNRGLAGKLM